MNLSFLRTFLEVIETGNLSKAADKLNVTQSTVTTRINALEDQVGQKLVIRSKSGAALTSAGFKLQRYAELMVQLWRQAQHEVNLPVSFETVCNIGCHYDLWPGVGRLFYKAIRAAHPEVAISVWAGEQGEMDRWIASGLVDVALCYSQNVGDNGFARVLHQDPLILVSSESPQAAYPEPPHLYVDLGEDFRRRHAATYPNSAAPALTFGNANWAMEHMIGEGGTGYLPESLALETLVQGALFRVEGAPVFSRAIHLVGDAEATRAWPWFDGVVDALSRDLAARSGGGLDARETAPGES